MRAVACAIAVFAAACAVAVSAQNTKYSDPLFVLETDGKPSKLAGRSCLRLYEDRPSSYDDNYLCTVKGSDTVEGYGLEYSNDHIIESKKCISMSIDNTDKTQGISDRVVERWADNFLCVPWESKLEFVWVETKPTTGRFDCIDFADTGFPHMFLCYRLERSIDCQVSGWGDWSRCDSACGAGSQSRTRSITQQPANDGQPCPNLVDKRPCTERECDEVLGLVQRLIRYVAIAVALVEAVALILLLAPLPGGYRQRFINGSIKLWTKAPQLKQAVAGLSALLGLALLHCVWVIVGVNRMEEIDTASNLDLLAFSDQAYLTGFTLLILLLLARFQHLLRHYMSKADLAAATSSPKSGTTTTGATGADAAKPTKTD